MTELETTEQTDADLFCQTSNDEIDQKRIKTADSFPSFFCSDPHKDFGASDTRHKLTGESETHNVHSRQTAPGHFHYGSSEEKHNEEKRVSQDMTHWGGGGGGWSVDVFTTLDKHDTQRRRPY